MSWNNGPFYPWGFFPFFSVFTNTTIDANGEYIAFIGRMSIAGQATSKTIDTTGSSAIAFAVASGPVFDNASSVFTIGFQGIDNTTGFPVRPDGVWAARSVVTLAANTTPVLTNNSDYHVAIPTAGTSTFSHGDPVCMVLEMTTRAGSDALQVIGGGSSTTFPSSVTNISGSVASANAGQPCIQITFSDGTLGCIEGSLWVGNGGSGGSLDLSWSNGTNPDENGLLFQTPWNCTVDGIVFPMRLVDAASDFQFDLVSAPTTAAASIISGPITMVAENFALSGVDGVYFQAIPPVNLTANTDYAIGVKANSTSTIRWNRSILPAAGTRTLALWGGTTVKSVTRDGGSGNYTAGSTTVLNPCGVRLSNITTSSGGMIMSRVQTGM